ncbi:MAG TPA: nuclease-related domain-containing protein [Methanocorpusculum sp.]|nr:nuclease-related domain-containing protein [Methanocorpusculum sp.]
MSEDTWQRMVHTPEEEAGLAGERNLLSVLAKIPGACAKGPLYIPTQSGGITEIDAVLVHTSGIFVFENKEYSGSISGTLADRLWLKTGSAGATISVANPVHQNRIHTQAAASALKVPEKYVHSVIVFSDSCDISRVPESRSDFCITQTSRIKADLSTLLSLSSFTKEEADALAFRLCRYAGSAKAAEKHAKHIADIKKERRSEKKRGR